MEINDFARTIRLCWSRHTATTYVSRNPALGQCSVTSLLAQDRLGGDILKTSVDGAWHFYNLIEGQRCDFTAGQFKRPVRYDDLPSSREEAFADTTLAQYDALCRAFNNPSAQANSSSHP